MSAFLLSFALIFAAEFGDKTQLVALAFATRYRATVVLAGIATAALVTHFISAFVGQAVGAYIPSYWLNVVAGIAFIIFGALAIRRPAESPGMEADRIEHHKSGAFLSVLLTFFVAELGDKTMLATIAIAGQQRDLIGVWLGSSAGMILSGALAIFLGNLVGTRIPEPLVRTVGAVIFFGTGIVTLARAAFAH